jgi:hypothetical protein
LAWVEVAGDRRAQPRSQRRGERELVAGLDSTESRALARPRERRRASAGTDWPRQLGADAGRLAPRRLDLLLGLAPAAAQIVRVRLRARLGAGALLGLGAQALDLGLGRLAPRIELGQLGGQPLVPAAREVGELGLEAGDPVADVGVGHVGLGLALQPGDRLAASLEAGRAASSAARVAASWRSPMRSAALRAA